MTDRAFETTVESIGSERDFYEVPHLPVNTVEKALGAFDERWKEAFDGLLKAAAAGSISYENKVDFAGYVVIQWMRTRTFRDIGHQIMEQAGQRMVDQLTKLNYPGYEGIVKFKIDRASMSGVHAEKLFEVDKAISMARDLANLLWIVGRNETAHPFYTSDQPVVRRGNRKFDDGRPMLGPRDPGLEFFFPLDSKHILLMRERTYFADLQKHENQIVSLTDAEIADCNTVMIMRSNQRLYCSRNEFDLATKVCTEQPEVRDPNRPRVLSGVTPLDAEMNRA
jgi:hypothetical protein